MIKNVIFDIGNVMVTFDPFNALMEKLGDENETNRLKEIIFSQPWLDCDNGLITMEEQIEITAAKSPKDYDFIKSFIESRIEMFHPIEITQEVVYALDKAGIDTYYLSDTSFDLIGKFAERIEYFRIFKGGVISCAEKALKSDENLKLFDVFAKRFKLDPRECVFIDDKLINIENAQRYGFNTVHLTDPSIMKAELSKFENLKSIF